MKAAIRIVMDENAPEEVCIRCHKIDADVLTIRQYIEKRNWRSGEIALRLGDREYLIRYSTILFFETVGDRVAAHTAGNMYYTDKTLRDLDCLLPSPFLRVSKSCILNSAAVHSLSRGLTGNCEVTFEGCGKIAYVSRMYYKVFRERIEETRLTNGL